MSVFVWTIEKLAQPIPVNTFCPAGLRFRADKHREQDTTLSWYALVDCHSSSSSRVASPINGHRVVGQGTGDSEDAPAVLFAATGMAVVQKAPLRP